MLEDNNTGTNKMHNENVNIIHWLEANGQFKTTRTPEGREHFITKQTLQSAYLTQLGGAVTLNDEGFWHYLLNRNSVNLQEGERVLDKLSILSEDGLNHELEIHILGSANHPFLDKVHYNQNQDDKVFDPDINQNNILSSDESDLSIESAIEEAESQYIEDTTLNDESFTEEAESIEKENSLEETIASDKILENEALEVDVKTQEDNLLEENLDTPEEKVDEEEMLAKVHALMLQKQEEAKLKAEIEEAERIKEEEEREKEAERRAKQEEEQRSKDKEAKEKADKEAMGGDEMLLKVQALMNAPKEFDFSEVEIVGNEMPSKKEEEEPEEENEPENIEEEIVQSVVEEHNTTTLKGKVSLEGLDGTEVFKNKTYLEGLNLEVDGSYHFEPHEISYEYLSENQVDHNTVEVSLTYSNGKMLLGSLDFSVQRINNVLKLEVTQGEFLKDKGHQEEFEEMSAEALAQSTEEFSHHSDTEDNLTDGHLHVVFDSLEEGAKLHSDGTLGITVMLPTGAQEGEVITINGAEFVINEAEAEAGILLYAVYPDDEVEVSFRDSDNNISDSIRAKANEHSVELLEFSVATQLMGEVGSQSIHASVGESESSQASWHVMDKFGSVFSFLESEFGKLQIDAETGEVEYSYYEGFGLKKYGKSADNTVSEKFILAQGNTAHSVVEVHLHIQAQSIHGYSGQEIDSSTIEGMKLLKFDSSMLHPKDEKQENIRELLEGSLDNISKKISKAMLEIYELRGSGKDSSKAKEDLQTLTDKKTKLEDKINGLN